MTVLRIVACVLFGMLLGACLNYLYWLVKNKISKSRREEYSLVEYVGAELTFQRFKDRAVEVYRTLDPDQRLLNGGYVGEFNYTPFVFKKGEKPELMAILTFKRDDESYKAESRQAWFPFELMNSDYISSLNAEDKIRIEWSTKSLPYGGGKEWKMVARFTGPIDGKFLNNRTKQ